MNTGNGTDERGCALNLQVCLYFNCVKKKKSSLMTSCSQYRYRLGGSETKGFVGFTYHFLHRVDDVRNVVV
jgi:hypothetical protein